MTYSLTNTRTGQTNESATWDGAKKIATDQITDMIGRTGGIGAVNLRHVVQDLATRTEADTDHYGTYAITRDGSVPLTIRRHESYAEFLARGGNL